MATKKRKDYPIRGVAFVRDHGSKPETRNFWKPDQVKPALTTRAGMLHARSFAQASADPNVGLLIVNVVEEMTGMKPGALAGTQGGAFLVELTRLAAVGVRQQ